MYLADDHLRRLGVRDRSRVIFASAGQAIFGVAKYRKALEKVIERRGIETMYRHDLVAVRPPDVIQQSPLAGPAGWVEVDKLTLQHVRFPNVFSLGDCSSLPTSRTGAAIRKQAPVLVANLVSLRDAEPLTAHQDGYASCPLVTGYGKLILAEFDYEGRPAESFPFDQSQERYSMYAMKVYALPEMCWNGMLRGRM